MDFLDRQRLVRRITSGKLYATVSFLNDQHVIIFKDPYLDILVESDWIYKRNYDKIREETTMFTLQESYDLLKEQGKWTQEMEKELEGIQKDIESISSSLNSIKFNKSATRAAKATIEKGKRRVRDLVITKNQLFSASIEFFCERIRRRFLISKIANLAETEMLSNTKFVDTLAVYYFEESGISESQIRELARTDPWRLYWATSKDTGTTLFPHSAVEMTDLQYLLVSWTKVYDFAFNSTNRPTQDIIEDNDKFDVWYRAEIDRIESDTARSAIEQESGKHGGTETFIIADEEGAKDVYKLNTIESRQRVLSRQKALDNKLELKELDLPDVKAGVKMELNRMAATEAKNRSR
jgi:hypothetical protein